MSSEKEAEVLVRGLITSSLLDPLTGLDALRFGNKDNLQHLQQLDPAAVQKWIALKNTPFVGTHPEAAGGTAHGTNDLETLMMMGEEMPSLRPALTHMMSRNCSLLS
jgi:hypothetical protein